MNEKKREKNRPRQGKVKFETKRVGEGNLRFEIQK